MACPPLGLWPSSEYMRCGVHIDRNACRKSHTHTHIDPTIVICELVDPDIFASAHPHILAIAGIYARNVLVYSVTGGGQLVELWRLT